MVRTIALEGAFGRRADGAIDPGLVLEGDGGKQPRVGQKTPLVEEGRLLLCSVRAPTNLKTELTTGGRFQGRFSPCLGSSSRRGHSNLLARALGVKP